MKTAVRGPEKDVKAYAAPHTCDGAAAPRRAGDIPPFDPPFSVPPAVSEDAVGGDRKDVDAVGVASRGGRLSNECAAQRFPLVPALAVPVAVPDLAVLV